MRTLRNLVLLSILNMAAWLLAEPARFDPTRRPPSGPATSTLPAQVYPALQDRLDAHLQRAERDSLRLIEAQVGPVRQLFAQARQGARPFAEELLGLGSKWAWLVDRLPCTRGDRQAGRVREDFTRHVLEPEEMARTVGLATSACLVEWAQARRSL